MGQIPITGPLADKAVNTIRTLAMDAVEKAGCGHPGLPMGAADYAFVLWTQFLRFDPDDPHWPDRDRFILSAGHGSMLLYALLHLFGFDLSLDDLKNFRQLHSRTPGHPEYGITPGVETTTGPLGQGFSNGVGMALAAKMLAARFNTGKHNVVNSTIYALCSDGDLMEGISHEAASLAGHLGLDNLVYYYDDNHITIEGDTALACSDDAAKRFEGYRWYVQRIDGHDREAIRAAIENALAEKERPSLIIGRTHIGYGAPTKQDTAAAHGAALGAEEVAGAKKNIGWPPDAAFLVPDEVRDLLARRAEEGRAAHAAWRDVFEAFRREDPERAALWDRMMNTEAPPDLMERLLERAEPSETGTRKHSGATLQVAAELVPSLVGGSADLAPSTNTILKAYGHIAPFLVFADYLRPSLRLSAIMGAHVIYVFTHDSVFVGEDGPTHQAVEQVAALRAIPNLHVIRPCGAREVAVAWAQAIERKDGPTALILTRQNVPAIDPGTVASPTLLRRGGYVMRDASEDPELILIATGSEVPLALEVQRRLEEEGVATRVVSLPCWELFDAQPQAYRDEVLPPACTRRVAIEAGVSTGWHKYVGKDGLTLCIDRFGVSGPYKELEVEFGFTPEKVLAAIRAWRKGA